MPKRVDTTKPATTTIAPSPGIPANKPPAVTAAPPSDWRTSWGKADDGKVQSIEKPAQTSIDTQPAPAKPALPHADSKRPDPLQMPQQFDRRPVEEKPSAQKGDMMPVPAAAVRRAPVPPITTTGPVYGTSAAVPAASDATMRNASTLAPPRQPLAQASNAFTPVAPTVSSAATVQPLLPTDPAGMIAQATTSGSNNAMNSSVITAGFQGPALANPSAPAAYQTMTSKPTPENLQQMVVALRDSLYPSQREWAAQSMAAADWRAHPQIVQALTTAAKEDPAATVRAGCVHCLANMKVNTLPVVAVVRGLRNDTDLRVRQEAERALSILAAGEK
jgi:hypothetical protein